MGTQMPKIAIDLLWLRPNKVGGTEPYVRNLLDSFGKLDRDFEFVLLTSVDNADTFKHYTKDKRFSLLVANIRNANIGKRIIWQNLFQNRLLKKKGIRHCFTPAYCKPWLNGGVEYIVTIHDLQAWYYPEYHPFHEVAYSRLCWYCDAFNAKKIIATTQWVKKDLMNKLRIAENRIEVINIAISIESEKMTDFAVLQQKYDLRERYFYTVSQLIPHKNFETLLRVMEIIITENLDMPHRLVITGMSGNASEQILKIIQDRHLEQNIILTGYIDDAAKIAFYKNCEIFLYPSVFEGFGMPPVEAMILGKKVVTTKCTSLPEVTQGQAEYVEDPRSVAEWIKKIGECINKKEENISFDAGIYNGEYLADKYLDVLTATFQ